MIIFYARCSTAEQNEARQLGDAHACHAEKIYIDKASGKNRDRPQLEANCEISIAKACRDLNVSREQLNNMIHKFRKNGMQISIIQASDIIKLPLNKNTEEAVYQYIVDHNYSISSRQMRTDLSLTKQQTKSFLQKFRRKGIEITVVESKKRNSDAQPQ